MGVQLVGFRQRGEETAGHRGASAKAGANIAYERCNIRKRLLTLVLLLRPARPGDQNATVSIQKGPELIALGGGLGLSRPPAPLLPRKGHRHARASHKAYI